jgi:hypothetical protein
MQSPGDAMASHDTTFPSPGTLGMQLHPMPLLRAGVCIRCAAAIAAHLDERHETDQIKVDLCWRLSGAFVVFTRIDGGAGLACPSS